MDPRPGVALLDLGRRLCLCDTTRPFRLDLTRGFRAPWTHDQEYPSWTWTSICWTDLGLVPPLEPGR
jgi:hypothetical protein